MIKKCLFTIILILLLTANAYGAITFDAIDDLVNCGTGDVVTNNAASSISAWIYPTGGGGGNFGRIFARTGNGTGTGYNFIIDNVNVANGISFFMDGSSAVKSISAANSITLNQWQFVLATWDGSGTATNIHIYVNGSEVSYSSQANGNTPETLTGHSSFIGNRESLNRSFGGGITEVAIWNTILSSGEIATLYGAGSPAKGTPLNVATANLQAYWAMTDGMIGTSADGDTVDDTSVNSNVGTGDNGANNTGLTWATNPANITTGAFPIWLYENDGD